MNNILLSIFLSTILLGHCLAQDIQTYRVNQGEVPTQIIPLTDQYRYDKFQDGKIHFHNGNSIQAKLNYSYLYKKLLGLGKSGDTIHIKHTYATKYISIGDQVFFLHPTGAYIEMTQGEGALKLATMKTVNLVVIEDPVHNGYDHASHSYELISHNRSDDLNTKIENIYDWPSREELLFKKETNYFLRDSNGRFHPINWKSLRKVFPEHKQALKDYAKTQQIDLRDKADLEKLITYCEQLIY
ncbi:hypothetical protein WJR50_05980 [Catalinimonas sp. 4WD22]|uniref:hypothetical protein n=1 Tax=Catalinimonas locisalis TaxID=3133978 RepID=UPI00310112F9